MAELKLHLDLIRPTLVHKSLLEGVKTEAAKYGVRIHIHVSETKKEVSDILETHGMRPFEYLDEMGFLGNEVTAAHAVWVSKAEIEIIKEKDVKLSHNPSSNMKLIIRSLSSRLNFLIKEYVFQWVLMVAASNNNMDLLEEMKIAALLQKVNTMNPTVLAAEEVFKMATINGANSLGLENEIGSIDVGKKADIVLVDMKTPI